MRRIDNFSQYMRFRGLSDNEVTAVAGLSNGLIGKAKQGKSDIGMKAVEKILSAYPEINRIWLLTGEGEMLKSDKDVVEAVPSTRSQNNDYLVPLIPTPALANSLAEYLGPGIRRIDCQRIVSPVRGAEMAITISGNSMEPQFQDGMVVFLKKINEAAFIPWGNPMILDTENGAFFKVVFPVEDDEAVVEARSLNPMYPPLRIPKMSIYGLYRVLTATKYFTTM